MACRVLGFIRLIRFLGCIGFGLEYIGFLGLRVYRVLGLMV